MTIATHRHAYCFTVIAMMMVMLFLPLSAIHAQRAQRMRTFNWHTHVEPVSKGQAYMISVTFETNDPIYYGIKEVHLSLCKDEKLTQPFMIECYRDSEEPMTAFTTDRSAYVMRNTFLMSGKDYEERTYFIPYESLSKYYFAHKEELGGSNFVTAYINVIISLKNGKVLESKNDLNGKPAFISWNCVPVPDTHAVIEDLGTDDISALFNEDEPCLDVITAGLDIMENSYSDCLEVMKKYEIGTCKHMSDFQSARAIWIGIPSHKHNNQTLIVSIYGIDRDRCYKDDCLINCEAIASSPGHPRNMDFLPGEVVFTLTRGYEHVCNFASSLRNNGFSKYQAYELVDNEGNKIDVTKYKNGKYTVTVMAYSPKNIRISITETLPEPEPDPVSKPEHRHDFRLEHTFAVEDYCNVLYDAYKAILEKSKTLSITLNEEHQVKIDFIRIREGEVRTVNGIGFRVDSMISVTPVTKAMWAALFPEQNNGYSLDDSSIIKDLSPEDRLSLLDALGKKADLGPYFHFHVARSKLLRDHHKVPNVSLTEEEEKWYGSLTDEGELYLVAVPQKKVEFYTKLYHRVCMYCKGCDEIRGFTYWPWTSYSHGEVMNHMNQLKKKAEEKGESVTVTNYENYRTTNCFSK